MKTLHLICSLAMRVGLAIGFSLFLVLCYLLYQNL